MIVPNPHLSIAIPTYNRQKEIVECLNSIVPQAQRFGVRIYISDNASDYDLMTVLDQFRRFYPLITYHRNPKNIGLDANVRYVISMVESVYVWVFSDDDTMADGALDLIVPLCESGKYALILPDREIRSQNMSQSVAKYSHINGVTKPTEFDDPVELFARYGYWHFTFVGSLLVKLSEWHGVDKTKYMSCFWFEHTCILAEMMLGRKALVLPNPLVHIRSGNNSYLSVWWSVWVKYFPVALVALPAAYPLGHRRKVLSDFVRVCGYGPLMLMLNGRALGTLRWGNARSLLRPFFHLRAVSWIIALCLAFGIPRAFITCLKWVLLRFVSVIFKCRALISSD
jgi:glycosyltransferase involved in cell wall biosynthesis